MESGVKAVLFDLDGTLVHSAPDMGAAMNAALAEYGLGALTLDEAKSFVGDGARRLVERSFARFDAPLDDVDAAVKRFQAHYALTDHADSHPYAGVADALDRLRARGLILGLCTNKDEAPARTLMNVVGLTDRFAAIVGGDTVGVRKPDPKPLAACAERCGVALSDIVFVGDGETDRATARAAEVAFALHTEGYRKSDVATLAPHASFAAYADLDAAVDDAFAAAGGTAG